MLAEYVYLGDQLLAMIKPGEAVYYFHNDHLGTPQVLTNDSQAIAWKAVYTPFGGAVTSIATVENPFRFPGQYYDPETGLHYNYFRYYNPQTGRYITPDPIGLEGGTNLFAYAGNNSINAIDPLGLILKLVGTSKEITSLRNWLTEVVGTNIQVDRENNVLCDFKSPQKFKEFENWLKEIIASDKLVTLQIGPTVFGGDFKDGIVTIDPVFLMPSQKELWYSTGTGYAYYTPKEIVAHELIGHASDWIHGGPANTRGLESTSKYERSAEERANKLRDIYGLHRRYR
jgi:RHS repeat-associated protein